MDQKPVPQKPSKERLRAYLYGRQKSEAPPPTPEEIRRQLGWGFSSGRSR